MTHLVYSYRFEDIQDRLRPVHISRDGWDTPRSVKLAINDKHLLTRRRLEAPIPAEVADLIDVATAIYTADRLSWQNAETQRSLHIRLPLREPDRFAASGTQEHLRRMLHWHTRDAWSFEFIPRRYERRYAEAQAQLPRLEADGSIEVALWSGGLDALAGACQRLTDSEDRLLTLFGVTTSGRMGDLQDKAAYRLRRAFPGQTKLMRLPLRLRESRGIRKNTLGRARGVVFLMLGAACALLEGQSMLHVYENGPGAINLRYRDGQVGIDHSRAVHPRSLVLMSEFLSLVLGTPFQCHNPFLLQTKVEMCGALGVLGVGAERVTMSCDSMPYVSKHQCGCCSSCLLRRIALTASGSDLSRYAILNDFYETGEAQPHKGDYLRLMNHQINQLRRYLDSADPWNHLAAAYPDELPQIADLLVAHQGLNHGEAEQSLMRLYHKHIQEWDAAFPRLCEGILTQETAQALVLRRAA